MRNLSGIWPVLSPENVCPSINLPLDHANLNNNRSCEMILSVWLLKRNNGNLSSRSLSKFIYRIFFALLKLFFLFFFFDHVTSTLRNLLFPCDFYGLDVWMRSGSRIGVEPDVQSRQSDEKGVYFLNPLEIKLMKYLTSLTNATYSRAQKLEWNFSISVFVHRTR